MRGTRGSGQGWVAITDVPTASAADHQEHPDL